jgi:uncharacterized protein (DUF58 family)
MNKKLILVVLIICSLLLSALILREGDLLLIAAPFMVYVLVGLFQAPTEVSLSAQRQISQSSTLVHEEIESQILIRNQGNDLVNLYLDDPIYSGMKISEGVTQKRLALSTGENAALNYRFIAGRGVYSWKAIQASAADPFGLFEIRKDIPASGEILVRSRPVKIRPVALKPKFTLHTAGPIPARLGGAGTDFWGVREYRHGDSLRRLNTRLAARHPRKLFTNEYEREEIGDFGLILDARKRSNADEMEDELFEHSVSAAAAFSERYLSVGNRVALLVFGETITSVFPGYGKKHLVKIQRELARARLGSSLPSRYLEYFPTRLFPTRSLILIFSTAAIEDLKTYSMLMSFGYDVILISPNPIEYIAQRLPASNINTMAVRAARLERAALLRKLLRLGVRVIDWQVDQPLETILNQAKTNFSRRRNL